ncbi:MAG: 3-deoxy-D-manno-octulosonic acid transferase [Pseudomonadota bacterium]
MYILYNIILMLLTMSLFPAVCVVLLCRKKYRCGFLEKCGITLNRQRHLEPLSRPVWIHAVSVGEVMAAVPLIKEIKKRYPGMPVLLSTVTETGNLTARRNLKNVDRVIFFPFDYPFIVKKVISRIKPIAFVTLETEIWPNFLHELKRQGIPSMIISGRISSRSFKSYNFFRFFFKRVLANISFFCMQTTKDAERIMRMGAAPENVITAGNIKFDQQVPPITPGEQEAIYRELKIKKKQHVFIAGSTHRGEEDIILDVFREIKKKFPDTILILAPRHPERFDEVEALLKQSAIPFVRKTALTNNPAAIPPDIVLLDTIGELSKIYSLGTIVFIGGSLVPVGGHNVLEPAVFNKPVIFGNFMGNFAEIAKILKRKKAALQVSSGEELAAQALSLFENPELCRQIGETAFQVIENNSGAVSKSTDILHTLLNY